MVMTGAPGEKETDLGNYHGVRLSHNNIKPL